MLLGTGSGQCEAPFTLCVESFLSDHKLTYFEILNNTVTILCPVHIAACHSSWISVTLVLFSTTSLRCNSYVIKSIQ